MEHTVNADGVPLETDVALGPSAREVGKADHEIIQEFGGQPE